MPMQAKTLGARAERQDHHPRLRALELLAHRLPRVLGQLAVEDEGLDAELRPEQLYLHFSKMHLSKMHFSKMHFSKMHFSKILQLFGGLVLGCIKTKIFKKICV